jgi:steroid delta-isomerase
MLQGMTPQQRVDALVRFFETLSPQSVAELPKFYATDCRFRDPFNDVRGIPAAQAIFHHMFERLDNPRFYVRERMVDAPRVMLTWDFEFRFRGWQPQTMQRIHGASLITFDADGLVAVHRDYWDAAEELYEKLPLLGPLLRLLKRQGRPKAPL